MNTRETLGEAGLGPAFFNVLAMPPFQQWHGGAVRHDLNNGPFMRDAAIVTLAFGAVTKHDNGRIGHAGLQVAGTPYVCRVRPTCFFAMGMMHHMWTYGYELEVLDGQEKAAEGHFHFTTHQPPARDGAMEMAGAATGFAIAEQEGNGAGLNHLYRQLVARLPEAKAQLGLSC